MSERYTKQFALPENQYMAGAPVAIAAGALLRDNKTGKYLAQVKLTSCTDRVIEGATLGVSFLDAAGASVGGEILHSLTGIQVKNGEAFGQKHPVVLLEGEAASFAVRVLDVTFGDGDVWIGGDGLWTPLAAALPLEEVLGSELAEEYRLEKGADCICYPKREGDLWVCTCGGVNESETAVCGRCGREAEAVFDCSADALSARRESRLAAASAKKKKTVKLAAIGAAALVVVIVAGVLISGAVKKSNAYKAANELVQSGKYAQAEKAFAALGDYKDSETLLADIPYLEAQKLYADGELNAAREAFLALGDYKDSAEIAADIPYQQALMLLEEDKLDQAKEAFAALGDYKDSKTYLADIPYLEAQKLLSAGELDQALEAFKALGDYKDSKEIVEDIPYRKAMGYMAEEEWQAALDIFQTLGSYKDSADQIILATQALCEHEYTDEVTKEPNCTETGVRRYTCGKCAKSYEEEIPIAHKYEEKVTRAATCSKEGELVTTCTVCGESGTSAIPMIAHKFAAATCTKAKTCKDCGATEGKPLPHNYAAATCQKPKTCVDCGATSGGVSAHTYAAATCIAPKTCTVCAATTGSPVGHSWVNATCAAPKTCRTCHITEGKALAHNFFSGTNYVGICRECKALDDDWEDYVSVSYSDEIVGGFQIVGYSLDNPHRDGSWIEFDLMVYVKKVEDDDSRRINVRSRGDSYLPSTEYVSDYEVGDSFASVDDCYFYGGRSYKLYLSGY